MAKRKQPTKMDQLFEDKIRPALDAVNRLRGKDAEAFARLMARAAANRERANEFEDNHDALDPWETSVCVALGLLVEIKAGVTGVRHEKVQD